MNKMSEVDSKCVSCGEETLWFDERNLDDECIREILNEDLKVVSMDHCNLTSFPTALCHLKKLIILTITNNRIEKLPKNVTLLKRNIIVMDLRQNPIVESSVDLEWLGKKELKDIFKSRVLLDDDIILDFGFYRELKVLSERNPTTFTHFLNDLQLSTLVSIDMKRLFDPEDSAIYPSQINFNDVPKKNNRLISEDTKQKVVSSLNNIVNDIFISPKSYVAAMKFRKRQELTEHLLKWVSQYDKTHEKNNLLQEDNEYKCDRSIESLVTSIFPNIIKELEQRLMNTFEIYLGNANNENYSLFKKYLKKLKELEEDASIDIQEVFEIIGVFRVKNVLFNYYFQEINNFNNLASKFFGSNKAAVIKRRRFIEMLGMSNNLIRFDRNNRYLFRSIREESGLTAEYIFKYGNNPRLINCCPLLPSLNMPGINDCFKSGNISTVGFTSGVISNTGSVYYAMDFAAGKDCAKIIPFYIFLTKPEKICAVSSHITKGVGMSGINESNAEGAEEYICTTLLPHEIIAVRYVNETGEIGEIKVNPIHEQVFKLKLAKDKSTWGDVEVRKFLSLNHIDVFRALELKESQEEMNKHVEFKSNRFEKTYSSEVVAHTIDFYNKNKSFVDEQFHNMKELKMYKHGTRERDTREVFHEMICPNLYELSKQYVINGILHSYEIILGNEAREKLIKNIQILNSDEKNKLKILFQQFKDDLITKSYQKCIL